MEETTEETPYVLKTVTVYKKDRRRINERVIIARDRGIAASQAMVIEIALDALSGKESSGDTVEALRQDLQKAREHIDHIATWCSQSVAGFTNRGVADAVIRMCDDYHVQTKKTK